MADSNILPQSHPFDETGVLAENYIENEPRYPEDRQNRAIIARFGSFFVEGFKIRDANGKEVPKDKYQQALYRHLISAKLGKDVIGGVIITDPTIPSPFYIDYHCVGGPFGASNEHIIELFNQLQGEDRPVHWPNILGKPDAYKPAHHFQDIGDLYGAEYFVAVLERLAQAFLMGDNASHDEIWRQMDDNFKELKDDLVKLESSLRRYIDQQDAALGQRITSLDQRLTNVRNELLAADNAINARITSVQQQLQWNIDALTAALLAHTNNKANPHAVTAAQAGAYTIQQVNALVADINNKLTGYVKKNVAEELALTSNGGQLMGYVNGSWRIIWPAQWAD
jgi:hypothetical protein